MKNLQYLITPRQNAISGSLLQCRKQRALRFSALFALLLLTFCLPALRAQLYTGSLSGTVTDPSGAAVPSANLTLTDVDKGFTYHATSDSEGRYLLGQVPPGTYNLSIETPNFQSQRKDAIKIDVNQNVSINFALKIG